MSSYTVRTLDDLDLEDTRSSSIYVCNKVEGNLVFTCESSKGKGVTIKLLETWIPQDLSTSTKRSDIIDSADFRRLVSIGRIDILDNKEAIHILQSVEGKKEVARVYGTSSVVNTKSSKNVDPKLEALIKKSNGKEVSASDTLATLRTMTLDQNDYQYIIKTSVTSMLKKFATDGLVNNQK